MSFEFDACAPDPVVETVLDFRRDCQKSFSGHAALENEKTGYLSQSQELTSTLPLKHCEFKPTKFGRTHQFNFSLE